MQIKILKGVLLLIVTMGLNWQLLAQDSSCSYLVWIDEFDYSGTPDPNKWGYDIGGGGWGNQEIQTYTDSRNNSWVENGKLFIKAIKNHEGWTSARMITKFKGDWLYGRIEVKAKLPSGRGTWPAIWMLPTDWEYGTWPSSGEIDIMEHVGYDPGVVHGTIHTEAYNHSIGTQKGGRIVVEDASSNFHVYAIEWTTDSIHWFVDDQLYFSLNNEKKTFKEWPFDKRFHLLLNIAIGGSWGGAQGIDPNLTEAVMEIDYVKVFQSKLAKPEIEGSNLNPGKAKTNYSTMKLDHATYAWEVPAGVEIENGQGTNRIDVIWGNEPGDIRVKIETACDTVFSDFFYVDYYLKPEGDRIDLFPLDSTGNLLWAGYPGDGNSFNLSEENHELIVGFQVSEPAQSPNIVYDFGKVVDLSELSGIAFEMSIDPDNPPSNIRIELEDNNGAINLSDLFKIDSFASDSNYHPFFHPFSTNEHGAYALNKIRKIRIYINYGVFGKSGNGILKIKNLRMQVPTATNILTHKSQNQLSIYPNPTRGNLTINAGEMINSIRIFSTHGKVVHAENNINSLACEIYLGYLNAGMYFVKVNEFIAQKLSIF